MRSVTQDIYISSDSANRLSIKELWLYRELFYFFAWRDIKVRYKQTVIGAGWAILQPLLAAFIFTIFFHKVAGIESGIQSIPYTVFAYTGLMYWNCFSSAVTTTSNSVVASQGIINKIYFPRLIPPLSSMALSVIDFFFAAAVLVLILVFFQTTPHLLGILLLLPSLALIIVSSLGVGIFFAALNVKYRDVRSALPFLIQILFFMTPVIYPASIIPQKFQIYSYLNPAAGAISSVKAGLFGQQINWLGLGISWLMAALSLVIGVWYFKRTEKNFVDII